MLHRSSIEDFNETFMLLESNLKAYPAGVKFEHFLCEASLVKACQQVNDSPPSW